MYAACSTTARRGALDWAPKFEEANKPVFEAVSFLSYDLGLSSYIGCSSINLFAMVARPVALLSSTVARLTVRILRGNSRRSTSRRSGVQVRCPLTTPRNSC